MEKIYGGWKSEEAVDWYLRVRRCLLRDKYASGQFSLDNDTNDGAESKNLSEFTSNFRTVVFRQMYPRESAIWTHSVVTGPSPFSDDNSEVFSMSDTASGRVSLENQQQNHPTLAVSSGDKEPSYSMEGPAIWSVLPAISPRRVNTDRSVSRYFEFGGMFHIFDLGDDNSITALKFGHNTRDLLAIGTSSGLCLLTSMNVGDIPEKPPEELHRISIEGGSIVELHWGTTNEFICIVSQDNRFSIVDVKEGKVLRESDVEPDPLCFCLHPHNDNILFISSGQKRKLFAYNVSTGRYYAHTKTLDSQISAICTNDDGGIIFGGSSKGYLYCFQLPSPSSSSRRKLTMSGEKGTIITRKKQALSPGAEFGISSIAYRDWVVGSKRTPMLLCMCRDNRVRVLSFDENSYKTETVGVFGGIQNCDPGVRVVFCPLISNKNGACFVVGNGDMTVNIFNLYDANPPSSVSSEKLQEDNRQDVAPHPVNKLHGHSAAVSQVDFSFDELFLASGDNGGTVIIWNRERLRKQ